MEGGELGPREGAVGYDAIYEGLVDGAAEKGAIAGGMVGLVGGKGLEGWGYRRGGRT